MSALRYPGGKTRAIKILDTYILNNIGELYSPFFGGGSFELFVQNKYNIPIFANDKFEPLIISKLAIGQITDFIFDAIIIETHAELISEEELIPIQNYMLGRILEDFDGPFARAHTFASLREAGLDFEFYNTLINVIKTTTPVQIRDLSQKYFITDSMSTVIAGTR